MTRAMQTYLAEAIGTMMLGLLGDAVVANVLPALGTPAASAARNREFIRTLGL